MNEVWGLHMAIHTLHLLIISLQEAKHNLDWKMPQETFLLLKRTLMSKLDQAFPCIVQSNLSLSPKKEVALPLWVIVLCLTTLSLASICPYTHSEFCLIQLLTVASQHFIIHFQEQSDFIFFITLV